MYQVVTVFVFSALCFDQYPHVYTAAFTTPTTSSLCPKCGTIAKSGKSSCCGRSGSWFGNCGSAVNSKLDHTWHEGIRSCKTLPQSKSAIGQRSDSAQQRNPTIAHGMANSKAVITSANTFAFTFTANTTSTTTTTTDTTTTVITMTTVTIAYVVKKSTITISQGMWYAHDVRDGIHVVLTCHFEYLNPYPPPSSSSCDGNCFYLCSLLAATHFDGDGIFFYSHNCSCRQRFTLDVSPTPYNLVYVINY